MTERKFTQLEARHMYDTLKQIAEKHPLASVTGDAVVARKALEFIDTPQASDSTQPRYVVEYFNVIAPDTGDDLGKAYVVVDTETCEVHSTHDATEADAQAAADKLNNGGGA